MTALRGPVEATRVDRPDRQPPVWFVSDEAGRSEVDLHGDLRAAFVRLARMQELWPVWGATAPLPDWRARIAEEKARWETRSDRNAPPPVASLVGALHDKAHADIGRSRAARSVRVASPTEQPFTPSEEARYHDEFLREQAAANAVLLPSEHRL